MDDFFNKKNVTNTWITCLKRRNFLQWTYLRALHKAKITRSGVWNEHLVWNEHITSLIASCYSALSIVKKLRNLAPYHVRKMLMETLILSKLDYSCTVFHPLPLCQLKRLQQVQNVCAGFVHRRYVKEIDCLSLGWLPLKER